MVGSVVIGVIITIVGILALSRLSSDSPVVDPSTETSYVDGSSVTESSQEVEIEGEINHPGIYSVEPTDTLGDLISMAGGVTSDADTDSYVSSYVIGDRDYFFIPSTQGEVCEPVESAKININDTSLTAKDIKDKLSITIAQAQAIIDYRKANGAFSCIEQLLEVKGIGQKTYEKIRGLVTLR